MSCNQPNRATGTSQDNANVRHPTSHNFVGGRLMLSNNPESVSAVRGVLWDRQDSDVAGPVPHRIFFWQVNASSPAQDRKMGVTIENTGTTAITIDNPRREKHATNGQPPNPAFRQVGMCNAKAMLGGTLEPTDGLCAPLPSLNPIPPGEKSILEEWNNVANGWLIGAVFEFSLTADAALNYKIRTAICPPDEAITNLTDVPLTKLDGDGYRGNWDTDTAAVATAFELYNNVGDYTIFHITDQNGEDVLPQAQPNGTANAGMYGAVYGVQINARNDTPNAGRVRVRIMARGGDYNGAVEGGDGVPLLRVTPPDRGVAFVNDFDLPANTSSMLGGVAVAHGGAANLAAGIYIRRIS